MPMMEYTFIRSEDGKPIYCTGAHCDGNRSIKEFFGLCEICWIKLKPEERAILRGEEPPVEKQVITQIMPEPNFHLRLLGTIWKILVTAAVGYLYFAKWMGW